MITVTKYGEEWHLSCRKGRRLDDLLRCEGIFAPHPCGGMGRCGRCRCRFVTGAPKATSHDRKFFSEKELEEGYRLTCMAVLEEDSEIALEGKSENMIKAYTMETDEGISYREQTPCAIAVDLGTTTIAAALVVKSEKGYSTAATASCANHQSAFGADVIARIAATENPETFEWMRDSARRDIEGLIKELLKGREDSLKPVVITVAGNTTMLNLLAGESIEGMGAYPYTPSFLEGRSIAGSELFSDIPDTEVLLMPGISAFVGADILSGLYYLDFLNMDKLLFLDLGTNGEMACWDGSRLRAASTAAGPVFEGGQISCGMPSLPGAICHVKIDDWLGTVRYETIFDRPAEGLCGTGLMEAVSEFIRTGIVDSTGLITNRYFEEGIPVTEDGKVSITQKDIRNLQLGKAAIYTGINTLLGGRSVDMVYVAGGFGSGIDPDRITNLRMFPEHFSDKIESSGNTSLKGAVKYAKCILKGGTIRSLAERTLSEIRAIAEVVELSSVDTFSAAYIESLNF